MTTLIDEPREDRGIASKTPTFLRGLWYLALPGQQLKAGQMLHRTLLDEPLVLARFTDGRVSALRDICPHRAVPLSRGLFDGKEIECCYHGWRFDCTGQCTAIPSLMPDQKFDVEKIHVRAYPCRESQGNIWVYFPREDEVFTTDDALPPIPQIPDVGDGSYQLSISMDFPGHVDHAVVGLMDPAHGPFVHTSWWWRSKHSIRDKSKAFAPSPMGFKMVRHTPSKNSPVYKLLGGKPQTEISFSLPGIRIEHVTAGKNLLCNLTAVTPVSQTQTIIHHMMYWNIGWLSLLKPVIYRFGKTFLRQDRDVVAMQQDGLQHDPQLMLISDADIQARWYYRLKKEFLASHAEGREFTNPVQPCTLRWRS